MLPCEADAKESQAMIRSLDHAQSELRPVVSSLRGAIQRAIEGYLQEHSQLRHRYTARTESSIIHDYMVREVEAEVDGVRGIGTFRKRGLFLVGVEGRWTIRLKKLDGRLQSSNIPTQQAMDFLQQIQPEIPGLEGPTNLQLGYQRRDPELASSPIFLTCPNGPRPEWVWPLAEAQDPIEPTGARLTPTTAAPSPRARVRAKSLGKTTQTAGNDK